MRFDECDRRSTGFRDLAYLIARSAIQIGRAIVLGAAYRFGGELPHKAGFSSIEPLRVKRLFEIKIGKI